MIYSDKKLAQLVVACCVKENVTQVVISPGSRNAPLTIGFTNQKEIACYSIVDERCAAFFALGIAQQTNQACALVCTSGSALLNYYPAIAEAFYSQIPLVVISADRPADRIDIGDGQTVRQQNVFENHILQSLNLAQQQHVEQSHLRQLLQRAIKFKGPVHLNVPFDEPLYGLTSQSHFCDERIDALEGPKIDPFPPELGTQWNGAVRKLILVGVHDSSPQLNALLVDLIDKDPNLLVFTETTSNLFGERFVPCIDQLINSLSPAELEALQPEILVSFGGMVISKKIKKFLRAYQPKEHWHIDPLRAYDTYFSLTRHVKQNPVDFFKALQKAAQPKQGHYRDSWLQRRDLKRKKHFTFLNDLAFCDLKAMELILETAPAEVSFQVSNSAVIRYVQLFGSQGQATFCNRGTSGIDGSTSTAIGAALKNEKQTVFITGDVSFFYDSNALWNTYIKKNFRIIILNNNGGGIFKIIPGPTESTALPYFETPHGLTAKHLCAMYGLEYTAVDSTEGLRETLSLFFDKGPAPRVLEIFTPSAENALVLKKYFEYIA